MTRSYLPIVTVNPKGKVAAILKKMETLRRPYKPTWWLIGPNIHTIWGMRFRGMSHMKETREEFNFEDGGMTYLDWFEKQGTAEDAPVLVVVHTLGGGTREPCTNHMCSYAAQNGWRSVVANCRGCSGGKLLTERLYNALQTDDLAAIIKHVKSTKKPSHIYLAGYSLGTMQSIQYAIDEGAVDAVAAVSHPYATKVCCDILERPVQKKLYLSVIMQKLRRAVEKNPYITGERREKALKAQTVPEFDDATTSISLGLKDSADYYSRIKLVDKVPQLKIPILLINSDDDPFTSPEFFPAKVVEESEYVASVRYPEGGHVSFCTGNDGHRSWAEPVIMDWFRAVTASQ